MNDSKSRCLTLKELFSREVINVVTGERLGYVCDAEVDMSCGEIRYFFISCGCKGIVQKRHEIRKFSFDDITKVGDEVILIKNCIVLPKVKKENSKKQL